MTEQARRRATPSPQLLRTVEPLLGVLGRGGQTAATDLEAQARMSRARFAVSQLSSVLVAFFTCCTLLVVTLLKINSPQDLLDMLMAKLNSSLGYVDDADNNSCPFH